jgi:antitoxin ParD1/3/4
MEKSQISVSLPTELVEFIDRYVESGQYRSRSMAIREALQLLQEREHMREWKQERLREKIQKGLDSGPATPFDVNEIKERGRERLAALNAEQEEE